MSREEAKKPSNFLTKIIVFIFVLVTDHRKIFRYCKKTAEKFVNANAKYLSAIVATLLTLMFIVILRATFDPGSDEIREDPTVTYTTFVTVADCDGVKVMGVPSVYISPYKEEAETMAKVLYGTARYNSEAGQKLVLWCILNRVESRLYADNVIDVCRQPQQWMGYSDDNPVIQGMYDLAIEVLDEWHNGAYRAMSPDYIYMSWNNNEIILRDEFVETKRTHYWHE